jgi:hypothetical protein
MTATSLVDWTQEFPVRTGLDQLGMRLASEDQYTQLVDYTTTVTWHPRYYSFLAWATRNALRMAGGVKGVERRTWQRTVRRLDYLLAAATLAESPSALAIIGSDKLRGRVERAAKEGGLLDIADDHVGDVGGTGSLEVYGGSMEALGLITQKDGISGPTPLGDRLADAFEQCVAACALDGTPDLANVTTLDIASLKTLARGCGIHQLGTTTGASAKVAAERDLLREQIVDWSAFAQRPQVRWRVQSIAIVLACHALMAGDWTTRATFREAILTGGVRGRGPLVMHPAFDEVRRYWRIYQAHAHIVFALESFLALGMRCLETHLPRRLVRRSTLLSDLTALVVTGHAKAAKAPAGLEAFLAQPLADVFDKLDPIVRGGCDVDAEPAIDVRLRASRRSSGGFREGAGAAHDAALLLLLSLARLRSLRNEVDSGWISRAARWRRSPATLLAHLDQALARRPTTEEYLRTVIDELVLRQHTTNAYRKLAEQEGRSTALFHVDASHLELIDQHYPGTTNPRFDNATFYLADLGYLSGEPSTVSADGIALLDEITRRSVK